MSRRWLALTCLAWLLVSCGAGGSAAGSRQPSSSSFPWPDRPAAPVQVGVAALATPGQCAGSFTTHTLPYTTTVSGDTVRLYDSNGSGVASGDLDRDGRLDLVFANLDGPDTIFWNEGNFTFRRETLDDQSSRAVNIVDVDGDGWPDIVFTHRAGGVTYWRNTGDVGQGRDVGRGGDVVYNVSTPSGRDVVYNVSPSSRQRRFVREALPGVLKPAYAMAWGDFNGDGTLELVTATYDAELERQGGTSFLLGSQGGAFYYQRRGDQFVPRRLAARTQGLALALPDLNEDGRPDLLLGNDFAVPDQAWLNTPAGWTATAPFPTTTHSTMSYDLADVDNDGTPELFATDMKPYDQSIRTIATWRPMLEQMPRDTFAGDPQIMENVLQVRDAQGRFHNQAYARGIDATGWSWSGKFGDLDNDGFVDLYVVNGMIAAELFPYLPRAELVEENQARRNDGRGYFVPAPEWRLGSTLSGRGMSMADLNNDGKLDIVVNNLRGPAQVFENRLCGGAGLEVDLFWPGTRNTRAIGAQLVLDTSAGRYYRDVRAGSGYLSGDPARVHFGVPAGAKLRWLAIRWPDGSTSKIDSPRTQTLLSVTRIKDEG